MTLSPAQKVRRGINQLKGLLEIQRDIAGEPREALPCSGNNALDALNFTEGLSEFSLRGVETIDAFSKKEMSCSIQRVPTYVLISFQGPYSLRYNLAGT